MSKARDIADLDFNSPDIDGGNIDGATIGGTTRANGDFLAISASSTLTVANTNGYGTIEVGGSSGAFIDLKRPSSDDYDLRIVTDVGTGGRINANGDIQINATNEAVFNENGADVDFRVESNNEANMFVVNGGTDQVIITNSVQDTASPNYKDSLVLHNSVDGGSRILFSNGVAPELASIQAGIQGVGAGTDDGTLIFRTAVNSTASEKMRMKNNAVVINEDSNDIDFRVESNNSEYMIYMDAAQNSVGIKTNATDAALNVNSQSNVVDGIRVVGSGGNNFIHLVGNQGQTSFKMWENGVNDPAFFHMFYAGNVQHTFETENNGIVFNEQGRANVDFRVESANNTHMLFVDGGINRIGIGNSSPKGSMHLKDVTDFNGSDVYYVAQNTTANRNAGFKVMDESDNYTSSLTYDNGSNAGVLTLSVPSGGSGQVTYSTAEMNIISNNSSAPMKLSTSSTERFRLYAGSGGAVFNELGNDYDFRVESNNNNNALFVDAGNDTVTFDNEQLIHAGVATKRGTYSIPAFTNRRIRITVPNYGMAKVKIAALRTNGGNSVVYWEGYLNNNNNSGYNHSLNVKTSGGTISYSFTNNFDGTFDWDFNSTGSGGYGSYEVESVGGSVPSVSITTY